MPRLSRRATGATCPITALADRKPAAGPSAPLRVRVGQPSVRLRAFDPCSRAFEPEAGTRAADPAAGWSHPAPIAGTRAT